MQLNYHRAGSGPPLVLIHGIGSAWQVWDPVLERLQAERDVIAFDLPGFADSPMPPPGAPAGVPSLTRLVAEFLDGLGLDRPHVAGNSLGGWISLELAKQGQVRSATALSPAGFHNEREVVYQRAALWSAVRLARLLAPFTDRVAASPAARKAAYSLFVAHPERLPAEDAASASRALAAAPWFDETLRAITSEPFTGGEQITVPIAIAWGERDRLLLPRQAPRALRAIPGARLVTLRGCGHVPTWDDPALVAEVMLESSRE